MARAAASRMRLKPAVSGASLLGPPPPIVMSQAVTEISDLISAQRAYEMNAKVVSAADQMMQSTANMFR